MGVGVSGVGVSCAWVWRLGYGYGDDLRPIMRNVANELAFAIVAVVFAEVAMEEERLLMKFRGVDNVDNCSFDKQLVVGEM